MYIYICMHITTRPSRKRRRASTCSHWARSARCEWLIMSYKSIQTKQIYSCGGAPGPVHTGREAQGVNGLLTRHGRVVRLTHVLTCSHWAGSARCPPTPKYLDIFKGAPFRLPKPLSDQFPVRVCSCPLCIINRL